MNLKLFGKNAVIYGIGNIGLRACSFLLIPIYTHTLFIGDYGLLCTLLVTIQIMVILMGVGMRTSLLRFAKEYENRYLMGTLLGSSTLINLVGGIIVTGVAVLFLKPFFHNILRTDHVGGYIILTCCAAVAQSLSLHFMSYYRARNEALKFTLIAISAALLLIIVNLVFLLIFHLGVKGVLTAYILTYSATLLFVSLDVFLRKTGITISIAMIPKLVRFGFPLIFSMLGQTIMGASSIYFLSYFKGLEAVAIYSLGCKLAQVLGIVLVLPFQLAYQPFVFANIDDPRIKETMARLFTYFIIAVAFISFSILLISRVLFPFIAPPEYSLAYLVTLLMLPAVAFSGLYYFGETLLNIVRKTHVIGTIVGICGIFSLLLNYALIPIMGWYGAIIASNASYISAGLIILILGLKAFRMPIEWLRLGIAAGIFAYFLLLVFVLHTASNLVFYGGAIIATCLIGVFINSGNFFDDHEKAAVRNGFHWIRLRLSL